MHANVFPSMQSLINITHMLSILCAKFVSCNNLLIFFLLWNYPLIFCKVQISTDTYLKKNVLNMFCPYMKLVPFTQYVLTWNWYDFVHHKGNNSCRKCQKKDIILESNQECENGLLVNTILDIDRIQCKLCLLFYMVTKQYW